MNNHKIDWDSIDEARARFIDSVRENRVAHNRRVAASQFALGAVFLASVGAIAFILNESLNTHV